MNAFRRVLIGVLAAALSAAACTSGDDESETTTTAAAYMAKKSIGVSDTPVEFAYADSDSAGRPTTSWSWV